MIKKDIKIAVWALTPNGAVLAESIRQKISSCDLYFKENLAADGKQVRRFDKISKMIEDVFHKYRGHIFIMSTGIVVRLIAGHIQNKMHDPAVVVMDEKGTFAISLISGHVGGANALTEKVSRVSGAVPVITTATDVNGVPAIDVLAMEKNLIIENPAAIKKVNTAFLAGSTILLHDPYNILKDTMDADNVLEAEWEPDAMGQFIVDLPGIFIDDRICSLPPDVICLRPRTLAAGIGCNRNTRLEEIQTLLEDVCGNTICLSGLWVVLPLLI